MLIIVKYYSLGSFKHIYEDSKTFEAVLFRCKLYTTTVH